MNSQKRNIDVWLIYRCIKCDNTYNMSILSRTKPELIKPDLFRNFAENNKTTAWEYAFSPDTAKRNNVEFDYTGVEYEILHDCISINDILDVDDKTIVFKIKTHFDFRLKLSSVIRICLGLSTNKVKQMIETEVISISGSYSLKNHKVKNGDIILINKEKLKSYIYK